MLLHTMSKILPLNEHIAHDKSYGIWKHKFRAVSIILTKYMHIVKNFG